MFKVILIEGVYHATRIDNVCDDYADIETHVIDGNPVIIVSEIEALEMIGVDVDEVVVSDD